MSSEEEKQLLESAQEGNVDKVMQCLKAGVNFNCTDTRMGALGKTPLHHAAQMGRRKIVEILIQCGANINSNSHAV